MINPPVLCRLNQDNIYDLVFSCFSNEVVAMDGSNFKIIWIYEFSSHESYSIPAPGYYNQDKYLDFMVKYMNGPGYPVYYNGETTILNGVNGKAIISAQNDTVGSMSSPVTISFEGGDFFIFWKIFCAKKNSSNGKYLSGTVNKCKAKYDSIQVSELHLMSKIMEKPIILYNSLDSYRTEYTVLQGILFTNTYIISAHVNALVLKLFHLATRDLL
ncbi:hypothetical protein A3Q56_08421 [Intoshia linei]|uniref:Uncharacterized protein n=1 Tax=Intoshia linei TaxID=1819745 RepID=A0A177APC1_9BILA|nr:hypothetical protein A3Q56_08421 [Intoshia linei]